jgi:UDP-glucose 4-epimerase
MLDYFRHKNVLITGGLGFLGSNLAHRLVAMKANVIIIDNLSPLYGGNLFNLEDIRDKCEIVLDDVRNTDVLKPYIPKLDVIFHFAAQVSYIDSLSMPFEDLSLNASATLQLLELCRKMNTRVKIVFSSSRMVLGKIETSTMLENTPTNPLSLYGIHKLTSEKYLSMYHKDFGIPSVVLRITNPYGPRQQVKHSKYALVGWFIRQAMEGKTIRIFGDGRQIRDYIFSDDIVEASLRCAATEKAIGEIVNLGSGQGSEFYKMVENIIAVVGNGKIEYIPWPDRYERIETGDVVADLTKLQSLISWQPNITLSEGIQRTYQYYKRNMVHYI